METVSGAQVRVVVLDACRNNPFAKSWRAGSRAVARGLAGIDVDDVLVIYAAAPGQTASDGVNSPFAISLAARLPEADLPLQLLGGSVRDDVLKATGGKQRPFISASITGTPIYLAPRTPVQAAAASPGAAPSAGVNQAELEGITWRGALATDSVSAFSTYLSLFPDDGSKHRRFKKGDSWTIDESFTLTDPVVFKVMEHDMIGGHDTIGTVVISASPGTYTQTMNGDRSEYVITYDVSVVEQP